MKAEKPKTRRQQQAEEKRQLAIEETKLKLMLKCRFKCTLTDESYLAMASHFQKRTYLKAFAAAQLCLEYQPITLRGLHYQMVSAGIYQNTPNNYESLKGITKRLREGGFVPFEWIVDNTRATLKPSSWEGLDIYLDAVKDAYRLNFWAHLPVYICVFVEKDALAGTLEPVTSAYGVALHVIRGYSSLSFAYEVAQRWKRIDKPISVYYLGDHDPSGVDLERNIREKTQEYSERRVSWKKLGITAEQVEALDLPLPVKDKDPRSARFVEKYGERTAELDALSPEVMRSLVEDAIRAHIPPAEWERLQAIEASEQESFQAFLAEFQAQRHESSPRSVFACHVE